jgi:uncharacterized membrane-anchored protein YjiN (DUF445 family)
MTDFALASGVSPEDLRRANGLARMRAIATGLLGLMAVVFVGASLLQGRWPALAYLRAFAEAGAVGACADWFAVTALFRRPLGLPIPHTAVIPRNKTRIGEALGGFIADNFLTETVLDEKLRQLEVAGWGGDWLSRPANARRVARRLGALLPQIAAALPPGALRDLAGAAALAAARATPAAPLAARLLRALWSDGAGEATVERVLARLSDLLAERQATFRDSLAERTHTWLPRWVDKVLAARVTEGLAKLLSEMADPDHPWRQELRAWVERALDRLEHDPDLQAQGERLKLRLIADPNLRAQAESLWAGVETRLADIAHAEAPELAERLQGWIEALGAWLKEDTAAQARLNDWSRLVARRLIAPRRHQIGAFVAQVVASWDARSVVDKLELQVGRDLQYIRINGTVVGGLTGLAIFAVARLTGLG